MQDHDSTVHWTVNGITGQTAGQQSTIVRAWPVIAAAVSIEY